MVTMQDVANYAGVSKTSVSRVVNGFAVSPEINRKVSEALKGLGYRPNRLARALTTNSNPVIGVIISDHLNRTAPMAEFLSQLIEVTSQLKKPLIVLQDNNEYFSRLESFQTLVDQRCEGIIYLSNGDNPYLDSSLFESRMCDGIPMAVVQPPRSGVDCFQVSTMNDSTTLSTIRRQSLDINESIHQIISVFNR
ncbi:LacI family DNA-binding transcriptional regulator [Vibrio sp. YIC-376]|uniref:LacI family DNA-binding transcriptional regulator n=1 Tax=Vibrio sp. YIC-376 TaxID=3136162 RepID=UPI00402AE0FF